MADMAFAPGITRGPRANEKHERDLRAKVAQLQLSFRDAPFGADPESRDSGFASYDAPRNDGSTRSARERAAVLFLGGGDHFEVFIGAWDRRARCEDVPLILDLVGGQRSDSIHFMHQLVIRAAEIAGPGLE